jgi:hypothetical protein
MCMTFTTRTLGIPAVPTVPTVPSRRALHLISTY